MAVRTANDLARAAQRSHDGRAPAEPNEEAFQFACDHIAEATESDGRTAEIVAILSRSRAVIVHLLSHEIPADLLPQFRELAELVRDMSNTVEFTMKGFEAGDLGAAA
ncbi:TPA: hypothetical protein ACOFCL_000787 [Stenotrophomonas maltophilia]